MMKWARKGRPNNTVQNLVQVFAEVRRVLRDDGSLWLVLGDKYQKGRLLGMPWRVALALQEDGWILRSDIIWHKPETRCRRLSKPGQPPITNTSSS